MQRLATALVCLCLLAGAMTARAADKAKPSKSIPVIRGERYARFPDFSPDGKQITFSLHGDIWVVASEGGFARRVTISDSYDTKPMWSPCGKKIVFSSRRSGNWDMWVTAPEGGKPRPITFDTAFDSPCQWSEDGSQLYFHSNRSGKVQIWRMPADGGYEVQLTKIGGRDGTVSSDGRFLVFSYGQADLARKQYRGESDWDLYVQELPAGLPRQITEFDGNDIRPFFPPSGHEVYYLSEREGVYNIFKRDGPGGEAEQVTRHEHDVNHPTFSRDGRYIVYEMGFYLWRLDLAEGKSSPVPVTINADLKGPLYEDRIITDGAEDPAWSPDGQHLAFNLRGDLWVMPASGGKARRFTAGSARDEWPKISPDGKRVAFVSDRSGNPDLWLVDLNGANLKQLTFDKKGDFYHGWHPNGQVLVFCSERSGNKDIWTLDLRTGERRRLTTNEKNDDDPVFSPDGKRIAFDSGRTGKQHVYVMNADGSGKKRLTSGEFDQVPTWSPDGKFIAFERNEGDAGPSIWVVSVTGGPAMQVVTAGSGPRWSPKGDLIAFQHRQGDKKMIYTVGAPTRIVTGNPVNFTAPVTVDLAGERLQAFQEAWKAIRDSFYDTKMHGVDWDAIKRKYEPVVKSVRTHDELISLIDAMLGELKASHMGIWGGAYARPRRSNPATGYLGLDLVQTDEGPYEVETVLPGGPADQAWIRPGDFVFEIAGKEIDEHANLGHVLLGKVGRSVPVRVGPTKDREKSRIVQVKPIHWGQVRGIEYRNWLKKRSEMVSKEEGNLGYIHLRMMGDGDLEQFKKAIAGPLGKTEGLILDIRNNGGGHIHQDLLDILTRRPFGAYHPRGGKRTQQPALYYTKPVVVLINERSFSDAEVFPWGFKALKRGIVVGVPTNGGVIGTGSTTLINGATLRLPRVGWFSLEGENLEGMGVKPDVRVEETLEDRLNDRDPQLKRAIEILKAEIEKTRDAEEEGAEEDMEPRGKNGSAEEEEGF